MSGGRRETCMDSAVSFGVRVQGGKLVTWGGWKGVRSLETMLGRSSLPPRSVQAVGTLLQNPSQVSMMPAACPELSLKPHGHLPIT